MKIDLSRNPTHDMRTRKMASVPQTVICQSAQSAETEDLHADYADFCTHLIDLGSDEIVPLAEFAIWRDQELKAQDEFTNPIPSIH